MALSDILKKYGDTTGIMQQPAGSATSGIVPYKTVASNYQVYNTDTNTLQDQQTFNYEPTGIMSAPTMEPTPMPDMGALPEPQVEQPYISGPTSVISYGTTEEGTPRLLTDIQTGETTYAQTGEPYTPPAIEPTPETPVEEVIQPCPEGYVYDPITSACVPIPKPDKDKPMEVINRPRDVGATAKATTNITKAVIEQGALKTPFGQDVNLTIDNSTILSKFGLVGKLVDDILIKGPADDRILQFGKYTNLPTDGITATKNEDGTVNVNITETGKYNFGKIQTSESLAGRLATTQKTDSKGNIIKAPNGQNMIVGPIQVNTFGKTVDISKEQAEKNRQAVERQQQQKESLLSQREGKVATGVTRPGGGGGTTYTPKTVSKAELDKQKADNEAAIDAFLSKNVTEADKQAAKKTTGSGASKQGGGGKIVCTMMNESYGFGSFRNKIWLAHSRNLSQEYEIGYHTLFLPLVNYSKQKGFTNTIVKKVLEHIARHRTVDIRKQQYNKVDVLGRTYRTILEPLCYITGRIKLWKKK